MAIAGKPEEARSLARGIARRLKHRWRKPPREIVLETSFGYLCLIAREGEYVLKPDRVVACRCLMPEHGNLLEEIIEAGDPAELREKLRSLEGFYAGAYTSRDFIIPVSYTHLTLPTTERV